MSRQDKFKPPDPGVDSEQPDAEDLLLQINLRLRLDEVAEVEAEQLRIGARRPPSQQELCRLAGNIYDARRLRGRVMKRELFGEPAWDTLLALYCLPSRGLLMTVSGTAHCADVPQTTGYRWQQVLQREGLIERGPQGADLRKQTLRLTPKGRELMDIYLTRLFYARTPVPPKTD